MKMRQRHAAAAAAFFHLFVAGVDVVFSEQEILREEISSLQANKEKLKKRVSELEDDLKKAKEELEKIKEKGANADEGAEVRRTQHSTTPSSH